MARPVLLILLLGVTVLLAGCGDLEEMIENSTAQTITLSRTIHDTISERNTDTVLLVEDVVLTHGQTHQTGLISLAELAEPIEASQLGLGDVRFFPRGLLRNKGANPALLTIKVIPYAQTELPPVTIGTISVAANSSLAIDVYTDLRQAAESIHRNLKAAFDSLDHNLLASVEIQVQGGDGNGVTVDWLQLAATPIYWRAKVCSPGSESSYEDNVTGIHDAQLLGSVSNLGEGMAELFIYLSYDQSTEPESDLIGHAFLSAGQSIAGEEMLLDGGDDQIKSAFKKILAGEEVHYDFLVLSLKPIVVEGSDLRMEIKVDVEANIF